MRRHSTITPADRMACSRFKTGARLIRYRIIGCFISYAFSPLQSMGRVIDDEEAMNFV